MNLAFVNYFEDILEELGKHILLNWTTQEQTLQYRLKHLKLA